MRTSWLALVLTCGSLALAGCDLDPTDWGSSDRYKEDFSYNYKLSPGGRFSLESFNGSVEVLGWDRDTVDVAGSKYASREDVMRDIKIDAATDSSGVRIRAIRPLEHNCNCGARFVVKVPRKILLDTIQTSNGSMRVESITGNARLRTSNGGIRVYGVEGDVEATTSNASIELAQSKGAANLRTSNGRIKADNVRGAFDAHTSNSSIDAQIAELDPNRQVTLESSNGSINLAMDSWKGNDIRAHTSNSSINLRLPDSLAAELRANTSNGNITSDFEITTTNFAKTHVNGKIGGGGALLDLNTSNGSIRLQKR